MTRDDVIFGSLLAALGVATIAGMTVIALSPVQYDRPQWVSICDKWDTYLRPVATGGVTVGGMPVGGGVEMVPTSDCVKYHMEGR